MTRYSLFSEAFRCKSLPSGIKIDAVIIFLLNEVDRLQHEVEKLRPAASVPDREVERQIRSALDEASRGYVSEYETLMKVAGLE